MQLSKIMHELSVELSIMKPEVELRDEMLFKQPESSHLGDCHICCLPLYGTRTVSYSCCSKIICKGCAHASEIRDLEMRRVQLCPFCREALPKRNEASIKQRMKRVDANDPAAMCHWGKVQHEKGDFSGAFKHFSKAAELGYADAHYQLSLIYHDGKGAEKDMEKEKHHLEVAAIGGHPDARFNLGCHEWKNGDKERATKHYNIAATQGCDDSIKALLDAFKKGIVIKEKLAAALRAHHAAVNATKSPQREEVEALLFMQRARVHSAPLQVAAHH